MSRRKQAVRPLGMTGPNTPVPFVNPFTERRQREGENRKLVNALHSVHAAIDNRPPAKYPHLQDNKKREYLMDMKYAKIERENTILLERLCVIARPRSPFLKPKTFRPGVALDHHLRPVIDNVGSDWVVPGGSLHAGSRRRELMRVMADNQQILERIYKSKGQYSAERWRQEGQAQERYAEIGRKQPLSRPHTSPHTSQLGQGLSWGPPHSPERVYGVPSSARPLTARMGLHQQALDSQDEARCLALLPAPEPAAESWGLHAPLHQALRCHDERLEVAQPHTEDALHGGRGASLQRPSTAVPMSRGQLAA